MTEKVCAIKLNENSEHTHCRHIYDTQTRHRGTEGEKDTTTTTTTTKYT